MEVARESSKAICEETNNTKLLFELYEGALDFQQLGAYPAAFRIYKQLIPYLASEPSLWLRLTECCLQIINQRQNISDISVLFSPVVGLEDSPIIKPCNRNVANSTSEERNKKNYGTDRSKRRELDENSDSYFLLQFADQCISICNVLQKDTTDKKSVASALLLTAFIACKRGLPTKAKQYAKKAILAGKDFLFLDLLTLRSSAILRMCDIHGGLSRDNECTPYLKHFSEVMPTDFNLYAEFLVVINMEWIAVCLRELFGGRIDNAIQMYEDHFMEVKLHTWRYAALGFCIYSKADRLDQFSSLFKSHWRVS